MRKLIIGFLLLLKFYSAQAQPSFFIYLQTEAAQPFFVKMNDQVYSSSAGGFLIIPNLSDSTYQFSLGSLAAEMKEARFKVEMKAGDRGFLLQPQGSQYQLTDLQSGNTVKAMKDQSVAGLTYVKRTDAFSSLLSKALGDTSLLYTPVYTKVDEPVIVQLPKEEKKAEARPGVLVDSAAGKQQDQAAIKTPDTTVSVAGTNAVKDSAAANTEDPVVSKPADTEAKAVSPNTSAAPSVAPYRKSTVRLYAERSDADGFGLVYVDQNTNSIDTVRLLIPNQKIIFEQADSLKNESFFLEPKKDTVTPPSKQADTAQQSDAVPTTAPSALIVNNCKEVASESDLAKLKKAVALKSTDESMVAEAKKAFRSKCFSSEQIRQISRYFPTNAGRYLLFDAAYDHVSDRDLFKSLQTEFSDTYYLGRFKALVGE